MFRSFYCEAHAGRPDRHPGLEAELSRISKPETDRRLPPRHVRSPGGREERPPPYGSAARRRRASASARADPGRPPSIEAQAHLTIRSLETASPEGEHVPMLMMRLDRTDASHWKSLHDDLVRVRPQRRTVRGHQGEASRQADERPLSVAGQGPLRVPCEHHGRRLRRQPEPADSRSTCWNGPSADAGASVRSCSSSRRFTCTPAARRSSPASSSRRSSGVETGS